MAQPARCEPPPHYEVVDADDRTVGNARFAKAQDAHDLRTALIGTPGVGRMFVARIVERVVVDRQVRRLGRQR